MSAIFQLERMRSRFLLFFLLCFSSPFSFADSVPPTTGAYTCVWAGTYTGQGATVDAACQMAGDIYWQGNSGSYTWTCQLYMDYHTASPPWMQYSMLRNGSVWGGNKVSCNYTPQTPQCPSGRNYNSSTGQCDSSPGMQNYYNSCLAAGNTSTQCQAGVNAYDAAKAGNYTDAQANLAAQAATAAKKSGFPDDVAAAAGNTAAMAAKSGASDSTALALANSVAAAQNAASGSSWAGYALGGAAATALAAAALMTAGIVAPIATSALAVAAVYAGAFAVAAAPGLGSPAQTSSASQAEAMTVNLQPQNTQAYQVAPQAAATATSSSSTPAEQTAAAAAAAAAVNSLPPTSWDPGVPGAGWTPAPLPDSNAAVAAAKAAVAAAHLGDSPSAAAAAGAAAGQAIVNGASPAVAAQVGAAAAAADPAAGGGGSTGGGGSGTGTGGTGTSGSGSGGCGGTGQVPCKIDDSNIVSAVNAVGSAGLVAQVQSAVSSTPYSQGIIDAIKSLFPGSNTAANGSHGADGLQDAVSNIQLPSSQTCSPYTVQVMGHPMVINYCPVADALRPVLNWAVICFGVFFAYECLMRLASGARQGAMF